MSRKKKVILCLAAAAVAAAVIGLQAGLSFAAEGADWDDLRRTVEAGGSYTLTGDIHAVYDGTVHVPRNAEIDLAGHELVIDGSRDDQSDMFSVTGTLKVRSSADSGTLSASTGRSVIGIDGGNVELDRVYLHGWKTDHIIYNDGGSLKSDGGKLFGLTTGSADGGGICLVNSASADMPTGVISRLEGMYGGGAYVDDTSSLRLGQDVLIENCFAMKEGGGVYWEYVEGATEPIVPAAPRDCTAHKTGDGVQLVRLSLWSKLKQAVNRGEVYTLLQDITGEEAADAELIIKVTGDAGIDLNGHTLTINSKSAVPVVDVAATGTFSLSDSKGSGAVLLQDTSSFVENYGTTDFTDVQITAQGAISSFLVNYGTAVVNDTTLDGQNKTNNCIINESPEGSLTKSELTVGGTSVIRGGAAAANKKKNGGGILSRGVGATVIMTGQAKVEGCSAAEYGGGIYAEDSAVTLSGSAAVVSCSSAKHGGGILSRGVGATVVMTEQTKIEGCSAAENGGGIYAADSTVAMNGSAAVKNSAVTATVGGEKAWGGGVFLDGAAASMTMAGESTITACTSTENGGGVVTSAGTFTMTQNAAITACHAGCSTAGGSGGAAYAVSGGRIIMQGSSRLDDDHSDNGLGGAAFLNAGSMTMTENASVTNCTAVGKAGGVFCHSGGSLTMDANSKIQSCTANNGGGMYCDSGNITLSGHSCVTDCTASKSGGGIYTEGSSAKLEMKEQAAVRECSAASESGGCVYNKYGAVRLSGSVLISDCSATYGGGVCNDYGTAVLEESVMIRGCSATKDGGGLNIHYGTASLSDFVTILNCTATQNGGGIRANGADAEVSLTDDVKVEKCSAQNGGGMYCESGKITLSEQSRIVDCISKGRGGGGVCLWNPSASFEMTDRTTITGCEASSDGGGIFNVYGAVKLRASASVSKCSSEGSGGGICNWIGTTVISGEASIKDCTASTYGGGLANWEDTTTLTGSSTITGCTAGISGGGVYVNNADKGSVHLYSPLAVTGNTPNDYGNYGVIIG